MLDIAEQPLFSKSKPKTAVDLVQDGKITLGAADAALILRELRYPRQTRDLTVAGRSHIAVLADMMRRRQWRDWDAIDFARVDGKLYIINGHHRLGAQVSSGALIRWSFVIHDCAAEADVAALYHTFDTNNKVRTTQQILNVIGAAELIGVSKTTASDLYNAVPLIMADFDFAKSADDPMFRRLPDLRMDKMKALQVEAQAWERAVKKAPTSVKVRLRTQGALAVALMCFKHRPVEAQTFWQSVAEDDGLRVGTPEHTYLKFLNNRTAGGTAFAIASATAITWNAHLAGKKLGVIRMGEHAHFRIVGTPVGR